MAASHRLEGPHGVIPGIALVFHHLPMCKKGWPQMVTRWTIGCTRIHTRYIYIIIYINICCVHLSDVSSIQLYIELKYVLMCWFIYLHSCICNYPSIHPSIYLCMPVRVCVIMQMYLQYMDFRLLSTDATAFTTKHDIPWVGFRKRYRKRPFSFIFDTDSCGNWIHHLVRWSSQLETSIYREFSIATFDYRRVHRLCDVYHIYIIMY